MMMMMDHSVLRWAYWIVTGFEPYQTVVFLYPVAGTMMAVIMLAMLKVGHCDMNISNKTCSFMPTFPLSFNLFSTGTLLGS